MSPGKTIAVVLGGLAALLVLLNAVVASGLGFGLEPEEVEARSLPNGTVGQVQPFSMPAEEAYVAIAERPLFAPDRRPPLVEDTALVDEGPVEEPVAPLDVRVRGILITDTVRVANVEPAGGGKPMRVREGEPLEGELADWTLRSVEPRRLVFVDPDGRESAVDLVTHTADLKAGPAPQGPSSAAAAREKLDPAVAGLIGAKPEEGAEQAGEEALSQEEKAAEIRRRIAERRAQLRAEAERRRAEE